MDESCVRIAFEGSDDHRHAAELFATWEDGVGGLRGVLADNGDDAETRLEGLRVLNRKFLTVMAERYRLLIDERLE